MVFRRIYQLFICLLCQFLCAVPHQSHYHVRFCGSVSGRESLRLISMFFEFTDFSLFFHFFQFFFTLHFHFVILSVLLGCKWRNSRCPKFFSSSWVCLVEKCDIFFFCVWVCIRAVIRHTPLQTTTFLTYVHMVNENSIERQKRSLTLILSLSLRSIAGNKISVRWRMHLDLQSIIRQFNRMGAARHTHQKK